MREVIEAIRYRCDGCGAELITPADDPEPAYGYHGSHMQIGTFGGTDGSWFACKRSCILKAIDAAEEAQ